jgi:hypothetical protein
VPSRSPCFSGMRIVISFFFYPSQFSSLWHLVMTRSLSHLIASSRWLVRSTLFLFGPPLLLAIIPVSPSDWHHMPDHGTYKSWDGFGRNFNLL